VSVSDLCIPTIDLPILLQEICGQILGIYKSLTQNVKIGTKGVQFPDKKDINGIFVAVFADLKTTYSKYKCKLSMSNIKVRVTFYV
jgi:hypothetical protein